MMGAHAREADPTADWAREHTRRYLDGEIELQEFWDPLALLVSRNVDRWDDPHDRVLYFARRLVPFCVGALEWGYNEPDDITMLRDFLAQWVDGLGRAEEEWSEIVRRKGRPLEYWDVGKWDA
jgi:hypothetical protein